MVRLRPEIVRRLVEELAAAAGRDRERVRNALLKKAGETLAQLRRELGDKTPAEALLAKLAELFLKELEA
jgi:predicted ArsR family transcriptional regulator